MCLKISLISIIARLSTYFLPNKQKKGWTFLIRGDLIAQPRGTHDSQETLTKGILHHMGHLTPIAGCFWNRRRGLKQDKCKTL